MSKRTLYISKIALSLLVSAALIVPCGIATAATNNQVDSSAGALKQPNSKAAIKIGDIVDTTGGRWRVSHNTDEFDRAIDTKNLVGQIKGIAKSNWILFDDDNTTYFTFNLENSDYPGCISFTYGLDDSTLNEWAQEFEGLESTYGFSFLSSDDEIVSFSATGIFTSSGDFFLLSPSNTAKLLDVLAKGGEVVMRVEDRDGDYALISIDCTPLPEMIDLAFPDWDLSSTDNASSSSSNR